MKTLQWKTSIVGFGKIGARYSDDLLMKSQYKFSTHIEVLNEHPNFKLIAVIDPCKDALNIAENKWKVENTFQVLEGNFLENTELLILSNPPENRLSILRKFSNLRAVIIEKPIGKSFDESKNILDYAKEEGIHAQVNFIRRYDDYHRSLASGELARKVGIIQISNCYYGNGILNNASHMIDLALMFFGTPNAVGSINSGRVINQSPIKNDINFSFFLEYQDFSIFFHPIDFNFYREVSMEFYGSRGYLRISQEGLIENYSEKKQNRALTNAYEIPFDRIQQTSTSIGKAFYNLYNNMHDVLMNKDDPLSSIESAVECEIIISKLLFSQKNNNTKINF